MDVGFRIWRSLYKVSDQDTWMGRYRAAGGVRSIRIWVKQTSPKIATPTVTLICTAHNCPMNLRISCSGFHIIGLWCSGLGMV